MSFDMALTDKLSVFVDDMRRLGVACLAPDLNASEASFSVEPHEAGYAVRYAPAALQAVGERAMEELAAGRLAAGVCARPAARIGGGGGARPRSYEVRS